MNKIATIAILISPYFQSNSEDTVIVIPNTTKKNVLKTKAVSKVIICSSCNGC